MPRGARVDREVAGTQTHAHLVVTLDRTLTRWQYIAVITQAYDEHLNLLLSEVQETVTTTEVDEETYEEIVKVHSSIVASTTHSPVFPRKHTIIHFQFPSCPRECLLCFHVSGEQAVYGHVVHSWRCYHSSCAPCANSVERDFIPTLQHHHRISSMIPDSLSLSLVAMEGGCNVAKFNRGVCRQHSLPLSSTRARTGSWRPCRNLVLGSSGMASCAWV